MTSDSTRLSTGFLKPSNCSGPPRMAARVIPARTETIRLTASAAADWAANFQSAVYRRHRAPREQSVCPTWSIAGTSFAPLSRGDTRSQRSPHTGGFEHEEAHSAEEQQAQHGADPRSPGHRRPSERNAGQRPPERQPAERREEVVAVGGVRAEGPYRSSRPSGAEVTQQRIDLVRMHGLHHVVVEARLSRLRLVRGQAVAGDGDEVDALASGCGADAAGNLVAVEAGKPHVHEGGIRLHPEHEFDGGGAVARLGHLGSGQPGGPPP